MASVQPTNTRIVQWYISGWAFWQLSLGYSLDYEVELSFN